jgi:phage shock protein E
MLNARTTVAALTLSALTLAACGGSSETTSSDTAPTPASAPADAGEASLLLVSPEDAAATIADAPENLVVLDVRTAEEFDEGHIDGAVMLDFYRDDFADELAKLDPDVPYVLYCRSGNRSGQTLAIMDSLGFTEVTEVDGGVINWQTAGLPLVTG